MLKVMLIFVVMAVFSTVLSQPAAFAGGQGRLAAFGDMAGLDGRLEVSIVREQKYFREGQVSQRKYWEEAYSTRLVLKFNPEQVQWLSTGPNVENLLAVLNGANSPDGANEPPYPVTYSQHREGWSLDFNDRLVQDFRANGSGTPGKTYIFLRVKYLPPGSSLPGGLATLTRCYWVTIDPGGGPFVHSDPANPKAKAESWDGLLQKWVEVPGTYLAVPQTRSISMNSFGRELDEEDTYTPPLLPGPDDFERWLLNPAGTKNYTLKAGSRSLDYGDEEKTLLTEEYTESVTIKLELTPRSDKS